MGGWIGRILETNTDIPGTCPDVEESALPATKLVMTMNSGMMISAVAMISAMVVVVIRVERMATPSMMVVILAMMVIVEEIVKKGFKLMIAVTRPTTVFMI